MKYLKTFILLCFFSISIFSNEQKKQDTVQLDSIKDIITNDRLKEESKKVEKKEEKKVVIKKNTEDKKYLFPSEENFWPVFSEYWLVKNASVLKWNFKKPDYGLDHSFARFLESYGVFEHRFKIIVVNTLNISHLALPTHENQSILLLSLPFIRELDLSKLEISLLLFEDYLRHKKGYFKQMATLKELENLWGTNFKNSKISDELFKNLNRKYDKIAYEDGFNFKQQFEVTKEVATLISSDKKVFSSYLNLLKKIDELVKKNPKYQNYTRIYPSPELQVNWALGIKK